MAAAAAQLSPSCAIIDDVLLWKMRAPIVLVTEYCSHGSVWSMLQKRAYELTLDDWRAMFAHVLRFLVDMTRSRPAWMHRDLHLSNIYASEVGRDVESYQLDARTWLHLPPVLKTMRMKIGDYGFASDIPSRKLLVYYDVHTFFNGVIQALGDLSMDPVSNDPAYHHPAAIATPTVASASTPPASQIHRHPASSDTSTMHHLKAFLNDVVPVYLQYRDDFRGCRQVSTGRLRDTDPQLHSAHGLLSTHPFFAPLRM
jgi:serine/threonine protein kinase